MEIDSSSGARNECILNVFEHHISHCVVFRTYVMLANISAASVA